MRFSYSEMKNILSALPREPEENETIHVHHCKKGLNNDRLYITNMGERIVFYCHHCGSKGSLTNNLSRWKRASRPSVKALPKEYTMPKDGVAEVGKWPVEARMWLVQGKIKSEVAEKAGMTYSPYLNRVCIPIVFDGEYLGYVARRIGDEGPKYLARSKDKERFIFTKNVNTVGRVVLVEDILSCIRLSSLGYNCLALQGVNITPTVLNYLTSLYNHYTVWLDNDNPQVKLSQAKAKSNLEMYGLTDIIKTEVDPKNLSDKQIKELLDA